MRRRGKSANNHLRRQGPIVHRPLPADPHPIAGPISQREFRPSATVVVGEVPFENGELKAANRISFKPEMLKTMDDIHHNIFDRNEKPQRMLTSPGGSL